MADNTQEQWRWIPGYEGLYDVSDRGRVRAWREWKDLPVPRILRQHPNGNGYLRVSLCKKGAETTRTVHRLVLTAFCGPRPAGMVSRHLDGNKLNNTLRNLSWGTQSENVRDSIEHGTQVNARKSHCPRGHEYNEANTHLDRKGIRHCRRCDRDRKRAVPRSERS